MAITKRMAALICIALIVIAMIPLCSDNSFADSKKPGKPTIKGVYHTIGKFTGLNIVKVSWTRAKGAKTYEVFEKKGSESWEKVFSTKKLAAYLYIKYDTKCQFKVRGINGKKKGKFSAVKSIKVQKPSIPVGEWFTFKEGNFSEEVFIDTKRLKNSDGKLIKSNLYLKDDENRTLFWGRTRDGLYINYYKNKENGRIEIIVGRGREGSESYADIDESNVEMTAKNITYYKRNNTTSISWTIDGSDPIIGIGDQKGTLYNWKNYFYDSKFTIGTIPRYKEKLPVAGSSEEDRYSLNLCMKPTDKTFIYTEETGDGANLLMEDGEAWDYATNDSNEEPLIIRCRVYNNQERVFERYHVYPPGIDSER